MFDKFMPTMCHKQKYNSNKMDMLHGLLYLNGFANDSLGVEEVICFQPFLVESLVGLKSN